MGGMGKTTLAQLVYNDKDIKSHFDRKIWVCVSDPFEEKKIARAIIEGLDRNHPSKTSYELETLMQCIYELLEGKTFLLVLDDVWNPTSRQWEELIKSLQNGATGSRVLVTTRKKEVVTLMKAEAQVITMDRLSEEFCLSLFYYNAGRKEGCVSRNFKDIGLELVKRCNGLPLAAKTLGSLMRNKKEIQEWQAVLDSKTWELREMQQDVFRPLLLSYHDLTPTARRCLLYCAVFPKDHEYDKDHLIELWMSQDYLKIRNSENSMMVGQNSFHELALRSFFQDINVDEKNYGKVTWKIHDIVHDFLQYLTENEVKHLECDAGAGEGMVNDKVHHLTLLGCFPDHVLGCKRLRTLTAAPDFETGGLMIESIVQLKSLRALSLYSQYGYEVKLTYIPENIRELIHLRFLDLSNNQMSKLPKAMSSLYNLQTLRLVGCFNLAEIDVRKLINLRHLHVQGCRKLRMIKGIQSSRGLQTLDEFRIGYGQGNKIEQLKDLDLLQGSLVIRFEELEANIAENAASILVNKDRLQHLTLNIGNDVAVEPRELLNVLEPHATLESLRIYGHKGRAFSEWLSSLHCLRVLLLDGCLNCEMLPPLGKLASLESMTISDLRGVSEVGVEFLGIQQGQTSSAFPKLKHLEFDDMISWAKWQEVKEENITIMPCLSHLKIRCCGSLKALPEFIWETPLQSLQITKSRILQDLYRQGIGECRPEWAKISHIPSIYIEDSGGKPAHSYLQSIDSYPRRETYHRHSSSLL